MSTEIIIMRRITEKHRNNKLVFIGGFSFGSRADLDKPPLARGGGSRSETVG